jgi:hypothetical protein
MADFTAVRWGHKERSAVVPSLTSCFDQQQLRHLSRIAFKAWCARALRSPTYPASYHSRRLENERNPAKDRPHDRPPAPDARVNPGVDLRAVRASTTGLRTKFLDMMGIFHRV